MEVKKAARKEKDHIAQLFNVRRERFGIPDDIYWGWLNPTDQSIDWKTWRHADADGIGGFANILRPMGFPCDPLPQCNDVREPTWLEIIRASKAYPRPKAPKKVNWKKTYAVSDNDKRMPEVSVLNGEQTKALNLKAYTEGVSPGHIVFSAMSRVIARTLIEGNEPFYWFFAVNIRGATGISNEQFNQASGINMLISPDSDASHWRQQMRLNLKAKTHWATWKLANIGKYIGDKGLELVYRLTSGSAYFAGSCSNLGNWPLEDAHNPEITDPHLLCAVGPGSPNYPVNSSMIGWNGETTLTLKLHPYICPDQALVRKLCDEWKEEVLKQLPETALAAKQHQTTSLALIP